VALPAVKTVARTTLYMLASSSFWDGNNAVFALASPAYTPNASSLASGAFRRLTIKRVKAMVKENLGRFRKMRNLCR
jgi:hypothetical protein